jgi:nucleotide-binding universal stress UspA family protein
MRVLLAIDGSTSSEMARQLVGSLPWPEGTIIEVAAAVEPAIYSLGMTATPMEATALAEAAEAEAFQGIVDAAALALEAPGRTVHPTVLRGRPATVLVHEANTFRAELIVVGSRGLGPFRSMLLGSVSAEVVDHAPCPVLVVRRPTIGSVLLAVDGSAPAAAAATFLSGARFLTGHPVEVLSVAPAATRLPRILSSGTPDETVAADETWVATRRGWSEACAAAATEQLRSDGIHARWSISQGDPAHEIIKAAEGFGCDLIVVGSRGLTGLTRILVGSVTRNVLLHTPASVLVVREPQRVRSAEHAQSDDVPVAVPVGAPAG